MASANETEGKIKINYSLRYNESPEKLSLMTQILVKI